MLQIKHLTVTLKRDLRTLLNDVNLTINDCDKVAVIGEEGDGKSTLLKIAAAPDEVAAYADFAGEIVTNGAKIGYLKQDLSAEEKNLSVYEFCSTIDGFFDATPSELAEIGRKLGFDTQTLYGAQKVADLSGGERVKLQLARLLLERPDIFLLDEPSNDIDIDALNWLERFINDAENPVLFVSHDETLIERTANVIVHIEQTRRKTLSRVTVARDDYRSYMEKRGRSIEKQTQTAKNEKAEHDAKMERYRHIFERVEHEQDVISRKNPAGARLLKKKMHAVKSLERRFEREGDELTQKPDLEDAIFLQFDKSQYIPPGKNVLDFELDRLAIDGRILSKNVKLRVKGAEKICITGKNGVGKTTLLRLIAHTLLERDNIKAAYMPQNYEELLDFGKTAVEFLAQSGAKDDVRDVRTYLGSVRFTSDEMSRPIADLSGGQRGKLFFVKMILDGANVLILDEPTRNFSPVSNPVLRGVLRGFGGAVIAVSHDRKFIAEMDKIYELSIDGLNEAQEI